MKKRHIHIHMDATPARKTADAQPRVVARSKRGTVEEFEEAGTGKKKYFARRSNGENLGRYNSIENAKSAVESAGVMNVSSGYQGPALKWIDL